MKSKFLFLMLSVLTLGLSAQAFAASYECVDRGSYVYARNLATGQGELAWDRDDFDNPALMCARWIGADVSEGIDRDHVSCHWRGSKVVLIDDRTGQGTLQWNRGEYDNPMASCMALFRDPNERGVKHPEQYSCKKTPTGYCAKNGATGQCTHQWTRSQFDDPKFMCHKWLRHQQR